MFLRNAWYVAASSDQVTDKPLARTLLNEPVVFFRDREGKAAALEDRCCHRGAPLSLGWLGEHGWVCGYHGLEFDSTGVCIHVPGSKGKIPDRARVLSYPVVEKTDYIWIWMGDPAQADPSTIVDYPPDDQVNWPREHDMLYVKASYVMVLENLMDLSHLSYLHKASIGSSEEDSAKALMDVKKTPNGVRFLRLMRNSTPPPGWQKRHSYPGKVDRWSDFEYVAPSTILQYSGGVNAGEYDVGVREGGHHVRTLHAVTPETETSCFYFFSKGDGYAKFEEPRDKVNGYSTSDVFREDAFILEQQQLRLNGYDTEKLLDIPSDVARVQMIRFLNSKIEEELAARRASAAK